MSQRFTDTEGRTWVVSVTVDDIKRVQRLAGVNLLEIVESGLIERLSSDPVLLCDTLYALCQPQADRDGITDSDFGRAMAGDVISDATAALVEGLVSFFPEQKRRLLQTAAAKFKAMETRALQAVQERLESIDPEAVLKAELPQPDLQSTSTSSPESAESIPAP